MSEQTKEQSVWHDKDDTLESKVYQAIGAGSMCWSETPKGVFDSDNAKKYGDALWKAIEAERSALLRERDNLRNFIENIIGKECWNRVEYLDGGDVQDEAERMGILVQVPHAIPCEDELCGCEGEDVDYLYNFAWRVSTLNTEKA
jgi:hypothetical protein